jgi:peptidoglycan/xylan/chitin deacetylase (PgdA/CDA1 family)
MKKLALIAALLSVGCLGTQVELANWPNGYKAAVCPTFEAELAGTEELSSLVRALGPRNVTFFVVAGYFQDNPQDLFLIRRYEIASMGWNQGDWKKSYAEEGFQLEEMKRAHDWLRRKGFRPAGFRAPFLLGNEATFKALEKLDYKYDSSQAYGFLPYRVGEIIEIPVSFNFDLQWSEDTIRYSTLPSYLAFQESYERGDLFTFYAHATTAAKHIENLTQFLEYIEARNVWVASCGQVADWWLLRENLEVELRGDEVVVRNKGDEDVRGATVKVWPRRTIRGAIYVWEDEDASYAVLPTIRARGRVRLVLE